MIVAVENMSGPVIHGTVTTFLGILMLAFSDFDFVYRLVLFIMLSTNSPTCLRYLQVFLPSALSTASDRHLQRDGLAAYPAGRPRASG